MKLMFVLCFLIAVGLAEEVQQSDRGCIYIEGRCVKECEIGTHSYTTGCDHLLPEATCENPNPELDTSSYICDYTACYCDPPTVRDTATDKCIPVEECKKPE